MKVRELINDSRNNHIPFVDYLERIPRCSFSYVSELIREMSITRNSKDVQLLEYLLTMASHDGVNKSYTQILCDLLKDDWHDSYEDIVMVLEEIKDPNSINCLYEAAINIPDYDDGRSLAKKCIWALGAINTEEANNKLEALKEFNDPIISEVAGMQLAHAKKGKEE